MRKLKKINRTQAKKLYEQDKRIIMVGNKVALYHFFSGWHLAYELEPKSVCISKTGYPPECEFERGVRDFEIYLEPELGSRAAFYIDIEELKKRKI